MKYVHEHPSAEEDFPDSDTSVRRTSETVVQVLSDNLVGLATSSKETQENRGFELQTVKIKSKCFIL